MFNLGVEMRVMVTGAGDPAGVSVIKILKADPRYEFVMGVDNDPLAAGLYLADKGIIGPHAQDKELIPKIVDIAKKANISMIIPTAHDELIHFARYKRIFEKQGIGVAISSENSLIPSLNKLKTYEFFKGESYCPTVYGISNVKFPAMVRPADERRGVGVYKAENMDELNVFLAKNDKKFGIGTSFVMQYLPGIEYSTYGISDLKGKALAAVPIKRIEVNGISIKAEVVKHPQIEKTAKVIAEKLKLQGAWNIKLMKVDSDGIKLIEVNPRFAGTTSLVDYAGMHMPHVAIKLFSGQKINPDDLKYKTGINMTRYNEEKMIGTKELVK